MKKYLLPLAFCLGTGLTVLGQTRLVADFWPGPINGVTSIGQAVGPNKFLLRASDPVHSDEPRYSDGTTAGTGLLGDFASGTPPSNSYGYVLAADGWYYFGLNSPPLGLWRTDGTPAGTVQVANSNLNYGFPVFVNGIGITSDIRMNGDEELYVLNPAGPALDLLLDIRPGPGPSSPRWFTLLGNHLYFSANNGTDGTELWRTDGTAAGTTQVADLNPGAAHSSPNYFVQAGGALFFTASAAGMGNELWRTDGTTTALVRNIRPGAASAGISTRPVAMNGLVYFTANDGSSGRELWRSDGTLAGTWRVADLYPGSMGADPQSLTVVGSTLYFSADDGTHGRELWKTDGTPGGTVLVADIQAGAGGSAPTSLFNHRGVLAFSADDGTRGPELWESLGTAPSTRLVADINPGPAGSSPRQFLTMGRTVYFAADDGIHGQELWASNDLTDLTLLPVTLAHFTAQRTAEGVELVWATASEPTGVRYVPERSPDGRSFVPLGQLEGSGLGQYRFVDTRPRPGPAYYRVRALAPDGTQKASRLVSVAADALTLGLRAWPQPATDRLQVALPGPGGGSLALCDALGRLRANIDVPPGAAVVELAIGHLPSGTYFLRARVGSLTEIGRVVKQ